VIPFKRARLTSTAVARSLAGDPTFRIAGQTPRPKKGNGAAKRKGHRALGRPRENPAPATRGHSPADVGKSANALFEELRAWRLAEAKRTGLPAFRIVNDRTLLGVAAEAPADEAALLRVAGIGPGLARRYGAELLRIVARYCQHQGQPREV